MPNIWPIVFVVLFASACSTSGEGEACTAGSARDCVCWSGGPGTQICRADPSSWSGCQCGVDWRDASGGDASEAGPADPDAADVVGDRDSESGGETALTDTPSTDDATDPDLGAADSSDSADPDAEAMQLPDQIVEPETFTELGPEPAAEVDTPIDSDGDGVLDQNDNCLTVPNPDQSDFDQDLSGDACDQDDDGDWVADVNDEAPYDPAWPGLTLPATIYAHTSSRLYAWNPQVQAKPEAIAYFDFDWDAGNKSVTDIAIDVDGRLYATSFDTLYRCSAVTAECKTLASLPEQFNGFTLVPKGTVDATKEVLIGVAISGSWNRIEVNGSSASVTQIGSYGGSYTSSGDAFSVTDLGTYASVNGSFGSSDDLVKVDPATGAVIQSVGPLTGYGAVYGLAGLYDKVYGFDEGGAVLSLDLVSGQFSVVVPAYEGEAWWGAGVSTRSLKDQPN